MKRSKKFISMALALCLIFCSAIFTGAARSVQPKTICFSSRTVEYKTEDTRNEMQVPATVSDSDRLLLNGFTYFSFELTASAGGTVCVGLKESGGALYWLKPESRTAYLVSDNGDITESAWANQGELYIPGAFSGKVVIKLSDFCCHPAYANRDTDNKLTLEELSSVQLWNRADIAWTFGNFCFSDSYDEAVSIEKIFNLSYDSVNCVDTREHHINADYTDIKLSDIANSQYLIFEAESVSGGTVCIGLKERRGAVKLDENGANVVDGNGNPVYTGLELYWPANNPDFNIYYIDVSGNITSAKRGSIEQGAITVPEGFSGHIAIKLSELQRHPGHNSLGGDSIFDIKNIDYLQFWNFRGVSSVYSGITLVSSLEYYIESSYAEPEYTHFGDINLDGITDIRDLVRFKAEIADMEYNENADLNFDGIINSDDLAVLEKSLLNSDTDYDPYGMYYRLSAISTSETLSDGSFSVVVDKKLPQALIYRYTDGRYILGAGNITRKPRLYSINGEYYIPEVVFNKTGESSAEYSVTVKGVKLNGDVSGNITFSYRYEVSDGELRKTMLSLTGDNENSPLIIRDVNPYIQADKYMIDPAVAASNGKGNEIIGKLSELENCNVYDSSFAFLSNNGLAAGIYTSSSFGNPYTISVSGDTSKCAAVSSTGYIHRFSDGTRAERESSDGTVAAVMYDSVIGFSKDRNTSGAVDWQDAALWLRTKIPQMSDELREYMSVGNWGQYSLAFPTGIAASDFNEDTYNAATFVYSTYAQALEVLRQHYNMTDGIGKHSFEMVGWQGRGHDYGWPDLSEQPFNPALGNSETPAYYKEKYAEYGGGLSFHINQSDVAENSNVYLNTSQFGNNSLVIGKEYNSVFGWDGYKISHFKDVKSGYVFNRINAFAEKYYVPFIIYSDVYTDREGFGYGLEEDRYAKAREVQHWKALGANVATEYYSQEKLLNGQFLFINMLDPSVIDCFMISGNARINKFGRNSADFAEKDLWGISANHLSAAENNKISHAYASAQHNVQASTRYAFNTYRGAFVNGILGASGILSYKTNENGFETIFGNGAKVAYNSASDTTTVYLNGNKIADNGGVFIQSPDGSEKALAAFSKQQSVSAVLPEGLKNYSSLVLYRLTSDGKVYERNLTVSNGSVSFEADAFSFYAIVPERDIADEARENYALSAAVRGSARMPSGLSAEKVNLGNKILTIEKPAGISSWNEILRNLGANMLSENGSLKIEYPAYPKATIDGDLNTYWEPNSRSNGYIEYTFNSVKQISAVRINESSEVGNKVTSFRILCASDENSAYSEIYRGEEIPQNEVSLSVSGVKKLRLEILSAQSETPRIAEISIY